ncbi:MULTISPECIES: hypothetical protein [unclassified Anabaena]|uniref:hypothetical protein n=1 Tax=unclassified Anabaena TaxID=2619674 RepID=UPI0039C67595
MKKTDLANLYRILKPGGILQLELNDINNASQFYNNRYQGDYMDEWPTRKKRRVYELLLELGLPEEGHLRKLDTQQMRSLAAKYGFHVCL